METLRNLREHLTSVETNVSRTILSIERGLETMEQQDEAEETPGTENPDDEELEMESSNDASHSLHSPLPRRASLAADTMGGPTFP
jgi:hypothetical protein